MGNDMVAIPLARYEVLMKAESLLQCMEEAGVDSWEGMELAMQIAADREAAELLRLEKEAMDAPTI